MSRKRLAGIALGLVAGTAVDVLAIPYHLFDYGYSVEGHLVLAPAAAPAAVDDSSFDYNTGLGTILVRAQGSGPHYFGVYLDHELDEQANTFFNEYGEPVHSPAASQSWEIDEPGYTFGNLLSNFQRNQLDNHSGVPSGRPDDVAMAMAWTLSLDTGQTAWMRFDLTVEPPTSGFYLRHYDPDSDRALYFSSSLRILGGATAIPDSGPGWVLPLLGGVGWWVRRRLNGRAQC